jgi:hypothetical protein
MVGRDRGPSLCEPERLRGVVKSVHGAPHHADARPDQLQGGLPRRLPEAGGHTGPQPGGFRAQDPHEITRLQARGWREELLLLSREDVDTGDLHPALAVPGNSVDDDVPSLGQLAVLDWGLGYGERSQVGWQVGRRPLVSRGCAGLFSTLKNEALRLTLR